MSDTEENENNFIDTVKNNKKIVVGIIIVLLLLVSSIAFLGGSEEPIDNSDEPTNETVEPADWVAFNEDQEQYYDSINTAVNETEEGDTVIISQGEYSETFTVSTDGVTIQGEELEDGQYDTTLSYTNVDYSDDRRTLNQMVYDNPETVETETVAPIEVTGDDVTIQDIQVEGDLDGYTTGGYGVFVVGDNATLSIDTTGTNTGDKMIVGAIKASGLTITDSSIHSDVIIYESNGLQIEDSEFTNTDGNQLSFVVGATNNVTLTGNTFDLYDDQLNTRITIQPNVPNRELDNVVQEINYDTYTFTNNEFNVDQIVLCPSNHPNVNQPTDCQGEVNVENNTADREITVNIPPEHFPFEGENNYWNP